MSQRGSSVLRSVDGSMGPAILTAISAVRRRRRAPAVEPDTIAMVCFGAIGDLILFNAVADEMRQRFPSSRVLLLGSNTNLAIRPLLGPVEFVEMPISNPLKAAKLIRQLDIDLLVDSSQWARLPAILAAVSGAYTVGFDTTGQRRGACYDRRVEHRSDRHELANFRALIADFVPAPGQQPGVHIPDGTNPQPDIDGDYLVLHAWPSGVHSHLKEWPTERWATVVEWAADRGLTAVLTGGPDDTANSARLYETLADHGPVIDLAGKHSLAETAAVLNGAAGVVSVNTGVMHLAACLDVPLVALSGPTSVERWGPLSGSARNATPATGPSGYLNLGFEYPSDPPPCMEAIATDDVIGKLEEVMAWV